MLPPLNIVLVHASGSSPSIFAVLRLIMFRARIDFSVESFVITALLARSEGGPRLENAVTSDAKIIDSGPKGTQAAKRHRTCQTQAYPRSERSRHQPRPVAWNENERRAEEQSYYPSPQCSHSSPEFYAVCRIVAASHKLIHKLQRGPFPFQLVFGDDRVAFDFKFGHKVGFVLVCRTMTGRHYCCRQNDAKMSRRRFSSLKLCHEHGRGGHGVVGGRTITGWPGVSGLTGGSGLTRVGLMGVVGTTGCSGRPRTDGGVFGSPGTGNTGAIPGWSGSGAMGNTGVVPG